MEVGTQLEAAQSSGVQVRRRSWRCLEVELTEDADEKMGVRERSPG